MKKKQQQKKKKKKRREERREEKVKWRDGKKARERVTVRQG